MLLAISVAVPRFGDSGLCCRTTPHIDFTDAGKYYSRQKEKYHNFFAEPMLLSDKF